MILLNIFKSWCLPYSPQEKQRLHKCCNKTSKACRKSKQQNLLVVIPGINILWATSEKIAKSCDYNVSFEKGEIKWKLLHQHESEASAFCNYIRDKEGAIRQKWRRLAVWTSTRSNKTLPIPGKSLTLIYPCNYHPDVITLAKPWAIGMFYHSEVRKGTSQCPSHGLVGMV